MRPPTAGRIRCCRGCRVDSLSAVIRQDRGSDSVQDLTRRRARQARNRSQRLVTASYRHRPLESRARLSRLDTLRSPVFRSSPASRSAWKSLSNITVQNRIGSGVVVAEERRWQSRGRGSGRPPNRSADCLLAVVAAQGPSLRGILRWSSRPRILGQLGMPEARRDDHRSGVTDRVTFPTARATISDLR